MKGDDIAERMLEFAVAVLRITTRLPADSPGRHPASQLVRAGTAGGAHYEEASLPARFLGEDPYFFRSFGFSPKRSKRL